MPSKVNTGDWHCKFHWKYHRGRLPTGVVSTPYKYHNQFAYQGQKKSFRLPAQFLTVPLAQASLTHIHFRHQYLSSLVWWRHNTWFCTRAVARTKIDFAYAMADSELPLVNRHPCQPVIHEVMCKSPRRKEIYQISSKSHCDLTPSRINLAYIKTS